MIAMTNPARPDEGIDLNAVAHREYQEARERAALNRIVPTRRGFIARLWRGM